MNDQENNIPAELERRLEEKFNINIPDDFNEKVMREIRTVKERRQLFRKALLVVGMSFLCLLFVVLNGNIKEPGSFQFNRIDLFGTLQKIIFSLTTQLVC